MPLQIGLDSGHAGVRRVAVEQRWGSVSVVPNPPRSGSVILSASAAGLTFRALSFPFSDRRRLEVMVSQELEHSLGFPPGEAAWDFVARPPQADGENVYVVACPRANLEAVLAASDARPTAVDAEPYAYQRVLALAGVRDALVADFGATHTTFCRIRGGHLDYVRVLLRGGNDLDGALARKQGGTAEQARLLKHDKGLALAELREFYDRVVGDALLPPEPADAPMYVTGGGARARGLTDWLANKLGRPVEPMPVPQGIDPYEQVVALGMALWGMRGGEGVNLFEIKETRSYARPIALFLLLIVTFISIDAGVKLYVYKQEYGRILDAIRVVCRTAGPNVSSLEQLQSIVQERKNGSNGAAGHNLEALVLQVADAVKEAREKDKGGQLKVTQVVFNATEVRLQGTAKEYGAVDALKAAMAKRFGDVNASSQNSPDGVSFTMTAPLPDNAPSQGAP
jgi:hypothetical protein